MSKAARVADAERTAIMLDLLRREYSGSGSMSLSRIVIEECAPGTGWAARRWADALVLGMWPSKGLLLDGYEIKASKQDLKKELADLSKHRAVARYCDSWTLVAWDEAMLVGGIPDEWYIQLTRDGEFGRELYTYRQGKALTPEPWPRQFVCSMVRNAYEQAPGAAYVARATIEANALGRREGKDIANGDWLHALKPLLIELYGKEEWNWPREVRMARDAAAIAQLAVERLQQGVLKMAATG